MTAWGSASTVWPAWGASTSSTIGRCAWAGRVLTPASSAAASPTTISARDPHRSPQQQQGPSAASRAGGGGSAGGGFAGGGPLDGRGPRATQSSGSGRSGLGGGHDLGAPRHIGAMARSGDADPKAAADGGAQLAWGQRADVAAAQGTVGGDEHGGRQAGDSELGGGLPVGVGGQRVGDAGLGGEAAGGVLDVAAVQAKEGDLVLGLEGGLLEVGISERQRPHHEAHTLSTSGLPPRSSGTLNPGPPAKPAR